MCNNCFTCRNPLRVPTMFSRRQQSDGPKPERWNILGNVAAIHRDRTHSVSWGASSAFCEGGDSTFLTRLSDASKLAKTCMYYKKLFAEAHQCIRMRHRIFRVQTIQSWTKGFVSCSGGINYHQQMCQMKIMHWACPTAAKLQELPGKLIFGIDSMFTLCEAPYFKWMNEYWSNNTIKFIHVCFVFFKFWIPSGFPCSSCSFLLWVCPPGYRQQTTVGSTDFYLWERRKKHFTILGKRFQQIQWKTFSPNILNRYIKELGKSGLLWCIQGPDKWLRGNLKEWNTEESADISELQRAMAIIGSDWWSARPEPLILTFSCLLFGHVHTNNLTCGIRIPSSLISRHESAPCAGSGSMCQRFCWKEGQPSFSALNLGQMSLECRCWS